MLAIQILHKITKGRVLATELLHKTLSGERKLGLSYVHSSRKGLPTTAIDHKEVSAQEASINLL